MSRRQTVSNRGNGLSRFRIPKMFLMFAWIFRMTENIVPRHQSDLHADTAGLTKGMNARLSTATGIKPPGIRHDPKFSTIFPFASQ